LSQSRKDYTIYIDPFGNTFYNNYSGEAIINGYIGGWHTDPIKLVGLYTDQTSWTNYLLSSYYDGSNWHYLPLVRVVHPAQMKMDVTFSNFNVAFNQVSVTCASLAQFPAYYSPLIQNSIFIDAVEVS
jgi:hypothetical protein